MADTLAPNIGLQADAALGQGKLERLKSAAQDAGQARPAGKPGKQADPNAVRRTSEEFEAVFISEMISHMFKGLKTDGMFQGGFGEGIWREHMFIEMGRNIARSGGVGVADQVMGHMLKAQGVPAEEAAKMAVSKVVAYERAGSAIRAQAEGDGTTSPGQGPAAWRQPRGLRP